jgi:energy-coupling factor transport system permease protein
MVSMAFALTTDPSDLARALVHRVGVSRRFAFGTLAAVQFLPALAEDARIARLIARGAVEPGRGWTGLRRAVAGLSFGTGVMLLAGAIRRAGAAALAMELRGLSGDRPASAWSVPRATRKDGVLAACAILLVLALSA